MFAKVINKKFQQMNNQLVSTLKVDNIRLKAHHGWYEEERIIGGDYSVSVIAYNSVEGQKDFSDLDKSINYEVIYDKVVEIMSEEFKLIEQSCKAIFDAMKSIKSDIVWEVAVVKENPPLKFVGSTSFNLKG